MTTAARRTALAGTLFAVTLTVLPARSETRDRPEVDTRRTECVINLNSEFFQQLPTSGRTIAQLANTVPQQITARFERDSRGRTNDVTIDGQQLDGQGFRWDFGKVRFNERACRVEAEIPRAEFGSGYSGKVQLTYHGPSETANERLYLRGYNIRSPGGPIRGDQLWFFKPAAGAQGTPGTPNVPVPGGDTPGFTGWQPRVGLTIRDRGLFSGSFKPLQHSREECDKHTVNGASLCVVLGSGNTTVEVFNLTASGFGYRGVGGSIPNLSFGDGYCNLDRCETQGTFFDQPVRKTLDGWRTSGADLLADTTVFFNQSQFRLDYRGKYSYDPDSTQITPPSPSVPIVPAPDPTESGFLIPNWGRLTVGLTGRYRVSVLPHENHDLHSVMVGGVQKFLCTEGVGEGAAKIDQINPDSVLLRKTSPQRAGWQWSPIVFSNSPEGPRGVADGTFYGKPVKATFWGLEARQGSPDFSMSHSVKLLETQSEVPFRLEGRVDLTPKF